MDRNGPLRTRKSQRTDRNLTDEGKGWIGYRRWIVTGIRWYRWLHRYRVGDIGSEFGRHDPCREESGVSGFGAESKFKHSRVRYSS